MNAHPTREEDFDLYALGALDGDEKLAFESHLAECQQCARKLAEARGRIAMLSLAAPRVEPSPAVKQRLMAQVRTESITRSVRNIADNARRNAISDALRKANGSFEDAAAMLGIDHGALLDLVQKYDLDPASTGPPKNPRANPFPGFLRRWRAAILVPAFAALAIATAILWQQDRNLDRQLAALRTTAAQQHRQLDDARHFADLIGSSDTVIVALAPQPGQPLGSAHVMYNTKMGMLMYDGEIAPAPSAKSYELWVIPTDGKPINAGVFNPVTGRADHWMMKMPPGVEPKMFAVTLEPQGGMPRPTGPMVLIGHA
jgi:anti-sigma-K factor RskA